MRNRQLASYGARMVGVVALLAAVVLCPAAFSEEAKSLPAQKTFASADEAVKALVDAVNAKLKDKDSQDLRAIFGPEAKELMSGDAVADAEDLDRFCKAAAKATKLVPQSDTQVNVSIGEEDWPFPIPIVKKDDKWMFDTAAGKEEILNRRIGRNELDTIQVCRAYVAAQREYASKDHDADDVLEFAQKIASSPDKHDGLYWASEEGQERSPLGPFIAEAQAHGYTAPGKSKDGEQAKPQPYHGYYFKILTAQGKHAPGGKYNYIINDNMIGGFALVACPAKWDNSGIMTFIVSHTGKIYQKDLGEKSLELGKAMTEYDPDDTWKVVKD